MTNLSKKLQKFYKKENGKVIFRGDITLSEIALRMWDALGNQAIDASVVSRVINGTRLFTPSQLDVFAHILFLSEYEKWELRDAFNQDQYEKYGLEADTFFSPYLKDIISLQLEQIAQTRIMGNPEMALSWANTLSHHVASVRHARSANDSVTIDRLHAEILLEKLRASRDKLIRTNAVNFTKSLVDEILQIAKQHNDSDLAGQAYFALGGAYYIAERYDQALGLFNKAVTMVEDDDHKLEILRGIALSNAYLGNKKGVMNTGKEISNRIKEGKFRLLSNASESLEGLARAQGLTHATQAIDTWKEGMQLNQQMNETKSQVFVRDIQFIRTQLEIIKHLEPNDKNFLNATGSKGLLLARKHGYVRHAEKIEKLLSETVIKSL